MGQLNREASFEEVVSKYAEDGETL